MEINDPEKLPADILLGIVNEKLRLYCPSKSALLYELGMDEASLDEKLKDFEYQPQSNQYRCR